MRVGEIGKERRMRTENVYCGTQGAVETRKVRFSQSREIQIQEGSSRRSPLRTVVRSQLSRRNSRNMSTLLIHILIQKSHTGHRFTDNLPTYHQPRDLQFCSTTCTLFLTAGKAQRGCSAGDDHYYIRQPNSHSKGRKHQALASYATSSS